MKNRILLLPIAVALLLSGCASRPINVSIALNDVSEVRGSINKNNVNNVGPGGFTPLLSAVLHRKPEIAKLLVVEKNADVNMADSNGGSPLFFAAALDQPEIAKLLIEHGANVNSAHNNGNTPLIMSATKANVEIVKLLIEKGANVNAVGSNGDTPLSAAGNVKEITKLLLSKGANASFRNQAGRTVNDQKLFVEQQRSQATQAAAAQRAQQVPPLAGGLFGVIVQQGQLQQPIQKQPVLQSSGEIKTLIAKKDMRGLRAYLDTHPDELFAIEDAHLRLLYTGPAELRIVDISRLVKNKTKNALVIAQINSTSGTYKKFTVDEMLDLKKMGISDEIVAAMISVTTEYNKEQKRNQQAAQPVQQVMQQQVAQQSVQQPAAESGAPAECLKLIAALKACDQAGGFLAMGCKGLARSQFNCPSVAQYM